MHISMCLHVDTVCMHADVYACTVHTFMHMCVCAHMCVSGCRHSYNRARQRCSLALPRT